MKIAAFRPILSGRIIFLFAFFLTPGCGYAQQAELDSILGKIGYKKDSVRAIFEWVIGAMEYDTRQLLLVNESVTYGTSSQNIVREAINRRKGVCQHYAELFSALLRRAGYQSYVVEGYTRQGMIDDKYGHAWNAVRLGGKWYFYDPTWASGSLQHSVFVKGFDFKWYKVAPVKFIETHIPFDPIWQLINPPLTHAQIRNNSFENSALTKFSYQDSIDNSLKIDEYNRIKASLARTRASGIPNSVVERYLKAGDLYVRNAGDYYALDKTHRLLAKAVAAYNEYIFSKNNQFKSPRWTDEMLKAFPEKMKTFADSANQLLTNISPTDFRNAQYQLNLKKEVADFITSANTETAFIEKYLATWKPMRMQHFYKR